LDTPALRGFHRDPFSNAFNYQQVPLKPARMVQRPLPASAKHIHLSKQLLNDPT
jgi:hypothetical protein